MVIPKSSNPAYKWVQMAQNETLNSKKVIMAGVTGGHKAGKSRMVTDSLTEEEVASGAQIWNVDLVKEDRQLNRHITLIRLKIS